MPRTNRPTKDMLHVVHQGIGPILIGSLLSDHYEQLHNYKLTLKQLDHLLQNDAWPHYKKWMRDRKLPSCSMQFSLIRIGRESWQRYPEMASCYKAHYKKWMRDRKLPSCSMQFSLIRIGRESWQRYPEMASCYKAAVIKSMLYWVA
eukprot:s3128_g12.t2